MKNNKKNIFGLLLFISLVSTVKNFNNSKIHLARENLELNKVKKSTQVVDPPVINEREIASNEKIAVEPKSTTKKSIKDFERLDLAFSKQGYKWVNGVVGTWKNSKDLSPVYQLDGILYFDADELKEDAYQVIYNSKNQMYGIYMGSLVFRKVNASVRQFIAQNSLKITYTGPLESFYIIGDVSIEEAQRLLNEADEDIKKRVDLDINYARLKPM